MREQLFVEPSRTTWALVGTALVAAAIAAAASAPVWLIAGVAAVFVLAVIVQLRRDAERWRRANPERAERMSGRRRPPPSR